MHGNRLAAIIGGIALAGLVLGGCGGNDSTPRVSTPPPASTQSYGNAEISAKATGNGYDRTIVVRAKDRRSGAPVRDAEVSVYGQMTSPHLMSLVPRDLHEISKGTYKGPYTFIMQGSWTVNIEVRSKKLGTSTSALPVRIGG